MGASTFMNKVTAKSPEEAFRKVRDEALYLHGHGGYTGTIAEKDEFEVITPQGDPITYANDLLSVWGDDIPEQYSKGKFKQDQAIVDDKWGPAGCICLEDGRFLFFGWASE